LESWSQQKGDTTDFYKIYKIYKHYKYYNFLINSWHSSFSKSFSISSSDKFPVWNKIKLSDSLIHFNMCTYFKDTSGLSNKSSPPKPKQKKKQTNETKRHDQTVWELPTVSIDTTSIQYNTISIQLYKKQNR
jgi:hypothetical protein